MNPSRQVARGKFRFALSLFSLFHILAIIGSAKDVYLEKFGADATAIGCLFSAARTSKHFFVRSKRVRNQQLLGKGQAFLLGICILNHMVSLTQSPSNFWTYLEKSNSMDFTNFPQVISFWSPLTEFLVGHLQEIRFWSNVV